MQEQKPSNIKNLGIAIAALSGFIIFSNGMGLLSMNLIPADESPMQDPVFSHFNKIAGSALSLGLGFLISGIFLSKFKNWARISAQVFTVLLFLGIWVLTVFLTTTTSPNDRLFTIFPYFVALFFSTPLVLLLIYLNKNKVKKHFA